VGSTYSNDQALGETGSTKEVTEAVDPDIVDWDGPDDPHNPMNWPMSKKWGLIAVLAGVTLVTWVLLNLLLRISS
jgi:hypothetical protein